ncbi:SDR family oxidoreductase [Sulfitobacter pseudonitzschiae]|uniref:SDR family oxidoreductase n=1 Tax=Pseudosulfitobacter pseudonitzschiae TaxID=1402135 RepID=A0A9Q2RWY8_9RHOB|nr:SDR family oxidoreductase [Pseudosulfitobacter pseudonitzschiae]MBM2294529.1 SDR family oxidoreductase [Pseudosulfitobacter pseudonitzschiae]MBM2299343.1 SDR family oxidoreductase [Pseudosulfitobacter pseudonitzschiae]MBM2304395.1 SDR family oxidoreductase [Pseudosulfitobacter pseudonitzschiae]MBM2314141.1 SDR family oxidoreductase [Pseudosulfitobacter pseudonitzschiae]MBM2319056.1 SDR family oxidoreductase [Pseudosulfitobacter pseudonitzschiae]
MRRVLITAGARGIGRAMADAFDTAGYDVWVTDLDSSALSDLPEDWTGIGANVADEGHMREVFDRIGTVDVVCANAGIAGPTAAVEDVSLDDWRTCFSVNLEGAFLAAKYAAPLMKKAGGGAMILTSSTAGQFGYPYRSPYAAAKWGVIGLMKTLAMELGPFGIRCNAICPGSVEGPRMEGVLEREAEAKGMTRDEVYEGYASGTSMRSFVEAQDIANMAVFLGSSAARMVSGQVIAVDGHTENPNPKL